MARGQAVSDEIRNVIIHLHLKGQSASYIATGLTKRGMQFNISLVCTKRRDLGPKTQHWKCRPLR